MKNPRHKPKNSRGVMEQNMQAWLLRKAKRTPADVVIFFKLFRKNGCDRQTARDLAMAKDGTPWN